MERRNKEGPRHTSRIITLELFQNGVSMEVIFKKSVQQEGKKEKINRRAHLWLRQLYSFWLLRERSIVYFEGGLVFI